MSFRKKLGIPASTLSHHLHRLREVGLVASSERKSVDTLRCPGGHLAVTARFSLFRMLAAGTRWLIRTWQVVCC